MSSVQPTAAGGPLEVNPYASPQGVLGSSADRVVFRPRLLPRDGWDVAISLGFLMLGIAVGAGFLAISLYPWRSPLIPVAMFFVILLPALFAMLNSVRKLTLDQDGIQVHRLLGGPRFLHWEQVRRIVPASREEVLLWGYLLPPLPAKATMNTISYLGHYRIDWEGGMFYFPPREADEFERAVRRWRSEAMVAAPVER